MVLYQPSPPPTFEVRQINTLQDLNDFISSLTPNELGPKDHLTFSGLAGEDLGDGRFRLSYTVTSTVDGEWDEHQDAPWGYWAIMHRTQIRPPWFEDDENFNRRFEPVTP
jgi:hypothetical protein